MAFGGCEDVGRWAGWTQPNTADGCVALGRLEASEQYSMADIPPLPESFRLPKEEGAKDDTAMSGQVLPCPDRCSL